jgi:hypothetical protein
VGNVTKELEDYGFEVDVYQGDNITVDFYRRLPTYGYRLIVFRAHSGLLAEDGVVEHELRDGGRHGASPLSR